MKHLARATILGVSVVTSGLLTVGMGVASADSITNTGPGSYNLIVSRMTANQTYTNTNHVSLINQNNQVATTGAARVTGNTNGAYGGTNGACDDGHTMWGSQGSNWNYWNPENWQQNGHSYNDWWSGMMGTMGNDYWPGGSGNGDWSNANDWNSWNPNMWCQHGSSYANWYGRFMSYLNNSCSYWQQHWPSHSYTTAYVPRHQQQYVAPTHMNYQPRYMQPQYGSTSFGEHGSGSSAVTGNASNSNATQANVTITNSMPSMYNNQPAYTSNAVDTISTTGPHSYNDIERFTSSNIDVTNNNDVNIANYNTQAATSGNASVSGNTNGGSAITGNAMNTNTTRFDVAISNN